MKKIILSLILLLPLIQLQALAQTVKGRITDAGTGEGIPFASVMVKGTMNGVSSDADGNYEISASQGSTLVFSSIGYLSQEAAVGRDNVLNAALEPDSESIDETIVVAYGVQKKSSFVGSASQVSGEKLAKMKTSDISKSLEGAVSGPRLPARPALRAPAPASSSGDSARCQHPRARSSWLTACLMRVVSTRCLPMT